MFQTRCPCLVNQSEIIGHGFISFTYTETNTGKKTSYKNKFSARISLNLFHILKSARIRYQYIAGLLSWFFLSCLKFRPMPTFTMTVEKVADSPKVSSQSFYSLKSHLIPDVVIQLYHLNKILSLSQILCLRNDSNSLKCKVTLAS